MGNPGRYVRLRKPCPEREGKPMLEVLLDLLKAWPVDVILCIIIGAIIVADIYDEKVK